MLADLSLRDLLSAFSSPDPTPGGGSAAALSSSVGAALLAMVAGLPKTRNGTGDDRAALATAAQALSTIRDRLAHAIDEDAAAYDAVVAAYRLPKGSGEEQAQRKASIQTALAGAADVPLGVLRMSGEALWHARAVAAHGHRAAASDVGVAIAMLRAGMLGARLNVEANVGSLSDAAEAGRIRAEVASTLETATAAADDAERLLRVA